MSFPKVSGLRPAPFLYPGNSKSRYAFTELLKSWQYLQPRAGVVPGLSFLSGVGEIMTSKQAVLVVVGAIVLGFVAGFVYVKRTGPHPVGTSSIVEPPKY